MEKTRRHNHQSLFPQGILHSSHIIIHGDGKPDLHITDSSQDTRTGQYFVSLPKAISETLPGSFLSLSSFAHAIGNTYQNDYDILYSSAMSTQGLVTFHSRNTTITIYNGSSNPHALALTELATFSSDSQHCRWLYQTHMYQLFSPITQKASSFDLRIAEDCLASGDTIVGILSLLKQQTHVTMKHVRIDVVTATTIGLCLLEQFAYDNAIFIDIHVGYVSYGLSKGTKRNKKGIPQSANYIVYPKNLDAIFLPSVVSYLTLFESSDKNIYVVGDMGDAGKSLPKRYDTKAAWNNIRAYDSHGDREKEGIKKISTFTDRSKPFTVYCANGGYLIRAFDITAHPNGITNHTVISAKRLWSQSEKYGYGILVNNFRI